MTQKENKLNNLQNKVKQKTFLIIIILLNIFILLSLFSYNINDNSLLANASDGAYKNYWGVIGAFIAYFCHISFGLASYIIAFLILVCSIRRLFGTSLLNQKYYLASLFFVIFGSCLLLGCFPNIFPETLQKLNLNTIPGGVIGARFTNPDFGYLYNLLNATGCIIFSLAILIIGIVAIWIYDWQELFKKSVGIYQNYTLEKRQIRRDNKIIEESYISNNKAKMSNPIDNKEHDLNFNSQKENDVSNEDPLDFEKENNLSNQAPLDFEKENDETDNLKEDKKVNTQEENNQFTEDSELTLDIQEDILSSEDNLQNKAKIRNYKFPNVNLITKMEQIQSVNQEEINKKRTVLQETLQYFKIDAKVGGAITGPRVTLFEVVPEKGVRVEKISNLSKNIAMELEAESIRIMAPIPGRRSVGVEVPNDSSSPICFQNLLKSQQWKTSKAMIPVILGKDISNEPVVMDLSKAPHLLIAGATGAGKSVFMNTLILSLLYKFSPDELQLIMVDPKFVEFTCYRSLPHLVCPVITEPEKATSALRWAVFEMECRYKILAKVGVRNLSDFNNRTKKKDEPTEDDNGNEIPDKLPLMIIIIDELADLMMVAKNDIETSIARIAQKARAVGIHLVIATQRPSVNVITGVIKANFPTRISFKVTSVVDSRTILDSMGAQMLLGKGDMLFMPPESSNLLRIQGAFVPDSDIDDVVAFCASQKEQEFVDIFTSKDQIEVDVEVENSSNESLIDQAIEVIKRDKKVSISHLQRRLKIGYNRAANLVEELEAQNIIGPQIGTAKREIYIEN